MDVPGESPGARLRAFAGAMTLSHAFACGLSHAWIMRTEDNHRARHGVGKSRKHRGNAGKGNAGKGNAGKRTALDRAAWIAEARAVLIEGGISAVKIGRLASKLNVTRESFYWHFRSLKELQDELLADWERGNTAAYEALIEAHSDGIEALRALARMWLDEEAYSPRWDGAVRDWARTSKAADRVVRRVDERRIEIIRQIFLSLGCDETEALVRARITYFHQVGYYALKPGESRKERLRLLPTYLRLLAGRPVMD